MKRNSIRLKVTIADVLLFLGLKKRAFLLLKDQQIRVLSDTEKYFMGECYRKGLFCSQNALKAFSYHIANRGRCATWSMVYCGILVQDSAPEYAFNFFLQAANRGDARAQNRVGLCYRDGCGIQKNVKIAYDFFTLSAKGNFKWGIYNMAYCLAFGEGTEKNINLAISLLKKKSVKSLPCAMHLLGICYSFLTETKRNKILLQYWLKKASRKGNADSMLELGIKYLNANDLEKAKYWIIQADQNGNVNAKYIYSRYFLST